MTNFYFLRILCNFSDIPEALRRFKRCGFKSENITAKKTGAGVYVLTGAKQIINTAGHDRSRWIEYRNGRPVDVMNLDKIRDFTKIALYGEEVNVWHV